MKYKEEVKTEQWFRIMEYCKKHRLPPAQNWAWELAKKELGYANDTGEDKCQSPE